MPITFDDGVTKGLQEIRKNLKPNVVSLANKALDISYEKVIEDQTANKYWTNRTGNALESIQKEIDVQGDIVEVAIGFEDGKPKEEGRNREYGQYIAEYQKDGANMSFLSSALSKLVSNINYQLLGLFKTTSQKSTFADGNWEIK